MQPQPNYDFIMNADHKPKKPLLPAGASKQTRIIIVAAGAVVLLLVILMVSALLSSAGKANKQSLLKAAQLQAEIIRISDQGAERAKGSAAKNLAMTTSLSIKSDQNILLGLMKSQGIKVGGAQLAAGKNQKTDEILTNAEQSNRFDEVFVQTIQKLLTDYQASLKAAYDNTSSQKLKQTLSDQFEHADLLATSKQ